MVSFQCDIVGTAPYKLGDARDLERQIKCKTKIVQHATRGAQIGQLEALEGERTAGEEALVFHVGVGRK
jgi:hypothetical protein